jgi:hypothetical protein
MPPFHVEILSDEFGQYTLILTCSACGAGTEAAEIQLVAEIIQPGFIILIEASKLDLCASGIRSSPQ